MLSVFPQLKKQPIPLFLPILGIFVFLNIDIETLDPKEPIVEQLYQVVENDLKKHPSYKNENKFILGYLDHLQGRYKKAHEHFETVSKDHALYATSLYYDSITLRSIALNESREDQEKLCQQSMESLEKVNELAPRLLHTAPTQRTYTFHILLFRCVGPKGTLDHPGRTMVSKHPQILIHMD
jgi:hypothetical protein